MTCWIFGYHPLLAQRNSDSLTNAQEACGGEDFVYIRGGKVPFSPSNLKEPIYIQLFDVNQKQYWAAPLPNTRQKTSGFGPRWGKFHHGIDLALRTGSPVYACFDGLVKLSQYGTGYGNYIIIQHDNGLESLYAHLYQRQVKAGQRVRAGQKIGRVGNTGFSTGPHLHFELRYKGYTFNPLLVFDFQKEIQIRSDKLFIKPHHFRHYGNFRKKQKYIFYEVGAGETLEHIGHKFQIKVEEIRLLNHLQSSLIETGQVLRLR